MGDKFAFTAAGINAESIKHFANSAAAAAAVVFIVSHGENNRILPSLKIASGP